MAIPAAQKNVPKVSGIDYNTDPRFIGTNAQKNAERQQAKKDSAKYLGKDTSDLNNLTKIKQEQISAQKIINPSKTTASDKSAGFGTTVASFAPSQTYLKAMEYTNQLLSQLSSGRTSYTDKINALMDQIENREKFNYDPDTDTLFQNSLAGAMNKGQIAMQDTMGQAASLTGGYGSTYATGAANQAYNSFIQDAYSNLPDYYNLALEAYNAEGQNLYNQLGMYQTADDAEYNRLANAYSMNMQNAAMLYDREADNYWKSVSASNTSLNNALAQQKQQLEIDRYNAEQAEDKRRWEAEYNLKLNNAKAGEATSGYKVATDATKVNNITKAFEEGGYDAGMNALRKYDAMLTDEDLDWFNRWIDEMGYQQKEKKTLAERLKNTYNPSQYR